CTHGGKVRWSCSGSMLTGGVSCLLRPGVAQGHAAVEYRRIGAVVAAVGDEVAGALELERLLRRGAGGRGLDVAGDGASRFGIEEVAVGPAGFIGCIRVGHGEQPVVEADLRGYRMFRADPVDGALDL